MESQSSNVIRQSSEDLGRDLHNVLFLKALTQYIPNENGFRRAGQSTITKLDKSNELWPWRRFLDLLCGLCCSDHVGESNMSIGVESYNHFWVAANRQASANKGANHLQRILKSLRKVSHPPFGGSSEDPRKVAKQICKISTEAAARRIKEYRRKLALNLGQLNKQPTHSGVQTDKPAWYRQLCAIVVVPGQQGTPEVYQTALSAYQFSKTEDYKDLAQLANSRQGVYADIQHLLGRLCCWHNASAFVTHRASYPGFARILAQAKVEVVADDTESSASSSIDVAPTVEQAFGKVFGNEHPINALASQKLHYCQPLLDKYQGPGKAPQKAVHAEALMARHFSSANRVFALDDPYIACTKPSCYACRMYMEALPMDFVDRPYHGNAWFAWTMPSTDQGNRQQDAKILRHMATIAQEDVRLCIVGDTYGRRQRFESTTGISGQVLEA